VLSFRDWARACGESQPIGRGARRPQGRSALRLEPVSAHIRTGLLCATENSAGDKVWRGQRPGWRFLATLAELAPAAWHHLPRDSRPPISASALAAIDAGLMKLKARGFQIPLSNSSATPCTYDRPWIVEFEPSFLEIASGGKQTKALSCR
jgi:hypothetical protein